MTLDLTTASALLKAKFTDEKVLAAVIKNSPALAMMRKVEDFSGDGTFKNPLIYANPGGISADFATAQSAAAASATQSAAYIVPRVSLHGVVRIANEAIEASQDKDGAFQKLLETETDGMLNNMNHRLGTYMYGTGYGKVGTIAAIGADAGGRITVALTDPWQAMNFDRGHLLQFAAAEATGALRASSGTHSVAAVNRAQTGSNAGLITFNETTALTGLAAGDVIFFAGDRANSPTRGVLCGYAGWVPTVDPTSGEVFLGIDRTVDSQRLAGIRFSAVGTSNIEEALIDATTAIAAAGSGRTKTAVMGYAKYAQLTKSLYGKVNFLDLEGDAGIGFPGIRLNTPSGVVDVVPDVNCPSSYCWLLDDDTWFMNTLKNMVTTNETDGMAVLRVSNADQLEARFRFRGNVVCRNPGANGVILL
jgi:hypothetical protein